MYDLIAIGESLIDFTPGGANEMGLPVFTQNPGGAPANVLAMCAKLGCKTAFIGKVGADAFGKFLVENMAAAGIDVSGVVIDSGIPTTLAFVHLDEKGDRSFSFYRKPGADILLREEELDRERITQCRIFHFGGVSLTDEPCRSATYAAVKLAKSAGSLVSYDPNYRPLLWQSEAVAVKELIAGVKLADVVKVSDEEMTLLTGETDLASGCAALRAMGPKVVLVTMGAEGAHISCRGTELTMPAYEVPVVDTTGAGDAFFGALLWQFTREDDIRAFETWSEERWRKAVAFSNAAGGLTTTKKGAIPAMPDMEEIGRLL